jgi:hypothetical protein
MKNIFLIATKEGKITSHHSAWGKNTYPLDGLKKTGSSVVMPDEEDNVFRAARANFGLGVLFSILAQRYRKRACCSVEA